MTIPATGDIRAKGTTARPGIQVEYGGTATNINLSKYYKGGTFVDASNPAPIATAGEQKYSNYRGSADRLTQAQVNAETAATIAAAAAFPGMGTTPINPPPADPLITEPATETCVKMSGRRSSGSTNAGDVSRGGGMTVNLPGLLGGGTGTLSWSYDSATLGGQFTLGAGGSTNFPDGFATELTPTAANGLPATFHMTLEITTVYRGRTTTTRYGLSQAQSTAIFGPQRGQTVYTWKVNGQLTGALASMPYSDPVSLGTQPPGPCFQVTAKVGIVDGPAPAVPPALPAPTRQPAGPGLVITTASRTGLVNVRATGTHPGTTNNAGIAFYVTMQWTDDNSGWRRGNILAANGAGGTTVAGGAGTVHISPPQQPAGAGPFYLWVGCSYRGAVGTPDSRMI